MINEMDILFNKLNYVQVIEIHLPIGVIHLHQMGVGYGY